MFAGIRKSAFNCPIVIRKNPTRKYALPVPSGTSQSEDIYPPILDISRGSTKRRAKEEWHNKILKLKSVEEKLFGLNMPYYYGWKSLQLKEGSTPYNSLEHTRYITKTHLVDDQKLPDIYDNLCTPEQLDILVQNVKQPIQDAIIFERCNRVVQEDTSKLYKQVNNISYQINRIILTALASQYPHLMEAEVDFEPRIESFWLVGKCKYPSQSTSETDAKGLKCRGNSVLNDEPVQYIGTPTLQLRNTLPLKEFFSSSECNRFEFEYPKFYLSPKTLGYRYEYKHATNIPGFWPGDPAEFGLLSYHNCSLLAYRRPTFDDKDDALIAQAIFASYSWLLSQACYQGFTTVNEMTYPLVTQTVLTDSQMWSFCAYQLNTILLRSPFVEENPTCNMCWITKPEKLFDTVENEQIHGFNEDVLRTLIKFYINAPVERTGVNMKPYLGESVKHLADISKTEERIWLENGFKYIMSNRPRHYKIPEIADWQKIYKIKFNTRPMDKKRDPWEFGYKPFQRRMDAHLPLYIPRALRENPKKRKVGRWAKTYYPDA
ncbi:mitochondrial ribosomal protein S30 [Lasioglossum baleicum]|uniref:mitochondrial ribosomal protein S30 n=1 Tax=Lasioglossum baleicum TaxID=434251 RepID=UPI003FCEB80A